MLVLAAIISEKPGVLLPKDLYRDIVLLLSGMIIVAETLGLINVLRCHGKDLKVVSAWIAEWKRNRKQE